MPKENKANSEPLEPVLDIVEDRAVEEKVDISRRVQSPEYIASRNLALAIKIAKQNGGK